MVDRAGTREADVGAAWNREQRRTQRELLRIADVAGGADQNGAALHAKETVLVVVDAVVEMRRGLRQYRRAGVERGHGLTWLVAGVGSSRCDAAVAVDR